MAEMSRRAVSIYSDLRQYAVEGGCATDSVDGGAGHQAHKLSIQHVVLKRVRVEDLSLSARNA
jgi:hypothetical protein